MDAVTAEFSPAVIPSIQPSAAPSGAFVLSPGEVRSGVVVKAEEVQKRYTRGMGSLADALTQARAATVAMDARDVQCKVKELRVDDVSGGWFIFRNGGSLSEVYPITPHALSHVLEACNSTDPRGSRAMFAWADPRERAGLALKLVRESHDPEKLVTLRLARHPATNGYVIRAVVTEKHSRATGDDLVLFDAIEQAVGSLADSARARIVKTWDGTDAEIIFPSKAIEVAKGDPVFYGFLARNSEVKKGSVEARGLLWRLTCTNGQVRPAGDDTEVTVRHVGDIRKRVQFAVSASIVGLDDFARQFSDSYRVALPADVTRADVLKAAGQRLALPPSTIEAALHLWDADGALSAGHTVAGLVNSLTRAAQAEPISRAREVEESASRLLTNGLKVLGLA